MLFTLTLRRSAFASFLLIAWAIQSIATAQQVSPSKSGPASPEVQAQVDKISGEVAEIRGLKFKAPIKAEWQIPPDFEKFIEQEFKKQMPEARTKYFGKIVTKLGLYRGPEIADFEGLYKLEMTSQAAAYYNPDTKRFYILVGEMPDLVMGTIFAHELYHGLQDQYFDLDAYIEAQIGKTLDDDQALARQSVVEGEATYIMTLWMSKGLSGGQEVDDSLADMLVSMQSHMDTKQLREMVKSQDLSELGLDGLDESVEAMDKIPRFMLETMIGAYMKGMAFVREVQRQGWNKIEELYTAYPPASTEQILHSEKWFTHEDPFKIQFDKFEGNSLFANWELLDSNVLGEVQWRIIFSEFDMEDRSDSIAAGWDGDRYAILKKKNSDELLLLLHTCWDTEEDAEEFDEAYQQLMTAKDPERKSNFVMIKDGKDVIISEGGEKNSTDDYIAFAKAAKKVK